LQSRPRFVIGLALFLIVLSVFQPLLSKDAGLPLTSIYGKVVDANTGQPIEGATILIWDLATLEKPKLGTGIYFTNAMGEYNVTGSYLVPDHVYLIYAYKGNFTEEIVTYVPALQSLTLKAPGQEVSFSLVPGALVKLEGTPYLV